MAMQPSSYEGVLAADQQPYAFDQTLLPPGHTTSTVPGFDTSPDVTGANAPGFSGAMQSFDPNAPTTTTTGTTTGDVTAIQPGADQPLVGPSAPAPETLGQVGLDQSATGASDLGVPPTGTGAAPAGTGLANTPALQEIYKTLEGLQAS